MMRGYLLLLFVYSGCSLPYKGEISPYYPYELLPYPNTVLNDVDKDCIHRWNQTQDPNYLLGTWFEVAKFKPFISPWTTDLCPNITFSSASTADINTYKARFNFTNPPYSYDDNPMKCREDVPKFQLEYLVLGHGSLKFMLPSPNTSYISERGYKTVAFKQINKNYLLKIECMWRSQAFSLLTRNRNALEQELQDTYLGLEELKRMEIMRMCTKELRLPKIRKKCGCETEQHG